MSTTLSNYISLTSTTLSNNCISDVRHEEYVFLNLMSIMRSNFLWCPPRWVTTYWRPSRGVTISDVHHAGNYMSLTSITLSNFLWCPPRWVPTYHWCPSLWVTTLQYVSLMSATRCNYLWYPSCGVIFSDAHHADLLHISDVHHSG